MYVDTKLVWSIHCRPVFLKLSSMATVFSWTNSWDCWRTVLAKRSYAHTVGAGTSRRAELGKKTTSEHGVSDILPHPSRLPWGCDLPVKIQRHKLKIKQHQDSKCHRFIAFTSRREQIKSSWATNCDNRELLSKVSEALSASITSVLDDFIADYIL